MPIGYLRGKPQTDLCEGYIPPAPEIPEESTKHEHSFKPHQKPIKSSAYSIRDTNNFTLSSISCCLFASRISKDGRDSLLSFVEMGLAKKHAKHPKLQFYPCAKCEANLTVVCESEAVESCPQGPGAIPTSTQNHSLKNPCNKDIPAIMALEKQKILGNLLTGARRTPHINTTTDGTITGCQGPQGSASPTYT